MQRSAQVPGISVFADMCRKSPEIVTILCSLLNAFQRAPFILNRETMNTCADLDIRLSALFPGEKISISIMRISHNYYSIRLSFIRFTSGNASLVNTLEYFLSVVADDIGVEISSYILWHPERTVRTRQDIVF